MRFRSFPTFGARVLGALLCLLPYCSWSQVNGGGAAPALKWEAMALAKSKSKGKKSEVDFPAALSGLHGRNVTVRGFMVPLEAKPAQVHFLLTSTPQDCEFCIEGGASSYVEVKSSIPLKFTAQPLNLVGRFVLLRDDPSGVYYRLVDARPTGKP